MSPGHETTIVTCRDCRREVTAAAVTCPHCGAPRPARSEWHGEGYEYKSSATFRGWHVFHVAFGIDCEGKVRVARGVVAIGQRAIGGVAIGILALGVVSCGVVSCGVISIGVVAVALAAAAGVNALAPFAFGVAAMGVVAGGVAALGARVLFSVAP